MSDSDVTARAWAESVAAMAADALLDAGLVTRDQLMAAATVVAEEIFARLCCHDYPPLVDYERIGGGAEPPNGDPA